MSSAEPLLSICIPTHNRADTLRLTLANVLSEAAPWAGKVEVVVSDNASTDATAAVLAECGAALRWQVRPENVGYFRNVVGMAGEIARGRFLWFIGDDDMIIRGSVARVLDQLERRPDLEFFYLNYSWVAMAERDRLIREADSRVELDIQACNFTTAETVDVARMEQLALLPNRNSCGIYCGMFSYVLPRDFYRRFQDSRDGKLFDCFSPELENIYPHAKILLSCFMGKPARLVGAPCLLQGVGSWEWKKYEVCYKIAPLLELLQYAGGLGMDPAILERMMADFDRTAGRNFARMVLEPEVHQGIETVLEQSLPTLSRRDGFWRAFLGALGERAPGWEAPAAGILGRLFRAR